MENRAHALIAGFFLLLMGAALAAAAVWFQVDTVEDFWLGFATNALCALHLDVLRGRSDHHKVEALFKAAGRALRAACEVDPRAPSAIPTTKGVLA